MPLSPTHGGVAIVAALALTPALSAARQQEPAQPSPTPPASEVQRPARQSFSVTRAASPISVDGVLDEPAWASATVIPVKYEWFPGDNTEPPVKTSCLVTYDGDNLYIAFQAEDGEAGRIRAHLADRDTAFQDDSVGFMIDPFNDRRRAFQFRINPLGVQMESILSDVDGSEDWSWDAIWDSAGRVTEDGYRVEVRIPMTSLRFPRDTAGAQTWGFLAMRDYPRSSRQRFRSVWTDRDLSCFVCQFDTITGFEGITPGRNLELDPTLTSIRSDVREEFPDGPVEQGDAHTEAGLTARWGITPNLMANAAINPDFSQVEADAAQLDINTRFALFFPEKRPFFLEGADFFATPLDAVFTRTVADPRAGLKLTGKEGGHAMGAFLTQDRVNNLIFPANQGSGSASIDQTVTAGVFRYRRDVGKTSTLGALYTDREAEDYFNRLGGFDGTLQASDADTIRFQYLFAATDYPDDVAVANGQSVRPIEGDSYTVRYNHNTRNWFWRASYEDLDPEFRADGGFIPRVDTRTGIVGIGRSFWGKPDTWFDRLEVFLGGDATYDHEGTRTDFGQDLVFSYQGPLQTFVEIGLAPNKEYFDGVTYDNFRQSLFVEMRPVSGFSFFFSGRFGETIDFDNSRPADFVALNQGIEFNLGRRLGGTLSYLHERLEVESGELYTARLAQARLVYHINLRTFFRVILQHTDIERDVGLYLDPATDPRTKELFSQLLFSYKINPQTVVLVGYSDNYSGGELAGAEPIDLTQANRTFFMKLGYAWVL